MKLNSHFFFLLAFLVFILAPLTAPGYFIYAHDARHSVYFLQMFDQSIRDGAWFPRWAADMVFGYGYPLWLILAPLPFFAGEAFHFVGFDFVSAVKIVDGLAIIFSALTMYLFVSRVFDRNAGLVAAIAYVYIPYHIVDLYVRATQAELVSFIFPPLIFWAFFQLATTKELRYASYAALSYAGLILSHISMAVIFTPVIGLYILFLLLRLSREAKYEIPNTLHVSRFAVHASLAIVLALGVSAIFLLPVFLEQRYLTSEPLIGGFFDYRKHFINANQLLSPFWGYGYAGENGTDQFSLQLGLVPLLLASIAIFALGKTRGVVRTHIIFFVLLAIAIVLAMLPISAGIWDRVASVIAFVQFPWRLLIVTSFALAVICGAAMQVFHERDFIFAFALTVLMVMTNYPYSRPQHTVANFNYAAQMEFEVKDRELLGDTIWTLKRPQDSPLVEQYINGQPLQKAISLDDGAIVQTIRHGGQSDDFRIEARTPARILIRTRYFPGWNASLDGQSIPIEPYGEQGLILARVPVGSHLLRTRFEDTWPRQVGAIISALALFITIGVMIEARARKAAIGVLQFLILGKRAKV